MCLLLPPSHRPPNSVRISLFLSLSSTMKQKAHTKKKRKGSNSKDGTLLKRTLITNTSPAIKAKKLPTTTKHKDQSVPKNDRPPKSRHVTPAPQIFGVSEIP